MVCYFWEAFHFLSVKLDWLLNALVQQQAAWAFVGSTALIGGLGAYFGAWGAQRSINKQMRLQRITEAINTANAAHSLTAVIFNQAASLKKQHYLPLFEKWSETREQIKKGVKEIEIHLQTPPAIHFPLAELSALVFGKLTLNGRPLAALSELLQAQQAFNHLIAAHDDLRKELQGKPISYVAPIYLSLETQHGQDSRYKDWCSGSLEVLDDFLFFSDVLAKDLVEHATRVRKNAGWRMRFNLPYANSAPKVLPEAVYLVPNHEYHKKWLANHVLTEPARWLGFLWFKRPN
ncbi:hypothetical protein [Ochrobactrum chromiisoli]|uniref:Uncharacterized protein n=1 Tax=Ochrobactrum chromiisoli TaxID=2993941 RepID=A0ABT3QUC1_9HYPH|nr:hypothetical protein [Ochrobactrum chromiisoli]MCX2699217.1 hypothetical protein [Ochrobactrum chromiisoli]